MNTYAIVESGVVNNVVLWDGDTATWQPPAGAQAVLLSSPAQAMIGYIYTGTNFSAPSH